MSTPELTKYLLSLRKKRPLILIISNVVTLDFIANGLLALGASPIVCCATDEIDDLCRLADAVLVNIGTLNRVFMTLAHAACLSATRQGKPIVLDPVGAAATPYRLSASKMFLQEYSISICRGNASEIMALADCEVTAKGVDSLELSEQAVQAAKQLAHTHGLTVVISGATDFIVTDDNIRQSPYGHKLMPHITGSGCLVSAVVAAFITNGKSHAESALAGVQYYGLCGEKAARGAICSQPSQTTS